MIFIPVKSYRTARHLYPRAYKICRVTVCVNGIIEKGFVAIASADDYLKWKASR